MNDLINNDLILSLITTDEDLTVEKNSFEQVNLNLIFSVFFYLKIYSLNRILLILEILMV